VWPAGGSDCNIFFDFVFGLILGGMVKAGFTYLSQNPSYYAQQLTHELGIEGDLSSDQILEILQSKSVEEIADRNNLVST
jgi:hypothetical protein